MEPQHWAGNENLRDNMLDILVCSATSTSPLPHRTPNRHPHHRRGPLRVLMPNVTHPYTSSNRTIGHTYAPSIEEKDDDGGLPCALAPEKDNFMRITFCELLSGPGTITTRERKRDRERENTKRKKRKDRTQFPQLRSTVFPGG